MTDPIGRPSDAALWWSVATTLRDVVLPEIVDPHVRATVVQLVGLAEYGRTRGADPSDARVAELATALRSLEGNPLVHHDADAASRSAVMASVAAALAAAASHPHDHHAHQVLTTLRPITVRHLDEDLAGNAALMAAFRGKLPDG